jgi:phosphate-selective porin OprO/OprP
MGILSAATMAGARAEDGPQVPDLVVPAAPSAPAIQPAAESPQISSPPPALAPDGSSAIRTTSAHDDPVGDLERRVADLERRLAQSARSTPSDDPNAEQPAPLLPGGAPGEAVQAHVAPPVADNMNAGAATGQINAVTAGWNQNGFFLQSADKSFYLHITGQLQSDFRGYLNAVDRTDIDQFLLRRARLGIEATMFDYYEFRLLPDFAGTTTTTMITDAYMNVHYWEGLQFEMGKFKQPVSYEQLIQDRYVPFMERSMIDQLVPARDVGVMIHGHHLWDDRLEYGIAVSNGEINGNTDTNDHKDLNARVDIRPFHADDCDLLRNFGFGVSGGVGIENEPMSPTKLATPATVPWLNFLNTAGTTDYAEGQRTRLTPELVYFYHSLGFASQYYHEEQQIATSAAAAPVRVRFDGYYAMVTYLLTGEERFDYTQQIVPLHPFAIATPFASPGAWEATCRVSRLDVSNNLFTDHLADPTKNASGALETTVGFNWYWNAWVRAQFNWEHAHFDEPVALGNATHLLTNHQDTLYCRFQFIF